MTPQTLGVPADLCNWTHYRFIAFIILQGLLIVVFFEIVSCYLDQVCVIITILSFLFKSRSECILDSCLVFGKIQQFVMKREVAGRQFRGI